MTETIGDCFALVTEYLSLIVTDTFQSLILSLVVELLDAVTHSVTILHFFCGVHPSWSGGSHPKACSRLFLWATTMERGIHLTLFQHAPGVNFGHRKYVCGSGRILQQMSWRYWPGESYDTTKSVHPQFYILLLGKWQICLTSTCILLNLLVVIFAEKFTEFSEQNISMIDIYNS